MLGNDCDNLTNSERLPRRVGPGGPRQQRRAAYAVGQPQAGGICVCVASPVADMQTVRQNKQHASTVLGQRNIFPVPVR